MKMMQICFRSCRVSELSAKMERGTVMIVA